ASPGHGDERGRHCGDGCGAGGGDRIAQGTAGSQPTVRQHRPAAVRGVTAAAAPSPVSRRLPEAGKGGRIARSLDPHPRGCLRRAQRHCSMDQFQDIRPYHDDEVRPVLDGLIANPDFIAALGRFSFPRLYRSAPGMVQMLVKQRLKWQMRNVKDVASMQRVIAIYMDQMIETTTSKLTHSGLDDLPRDKTYLFVSNHRDIAMDPGFVNYMLYHAGFDTVYIAIGDNLLKRPFVTDLMRLNKSFIVRRGLKGRELLKSSKLLSEYIHHCIESRHNVWIAQREGRAKDGVDRTDTALLKMLAMAKKSEGFQQALNSLHIVPVAISYEFDPCDALKADELYQKETTGTFQKTEQSDIHSIVTGLVGFKGHVHVAFGKEIVLES